MNLSFQEEKQRGKDDEDSGTAMAVVEKSWGN